MITNHGAGSDAILALPVLLPMLGAALTLVAGHRPRLQRAISLLTLLAVVGVGAVLVYRAETGGIQTLWLAAWPDTAGVVLVADRLSALMSLVASVVTLAVLVYSTGQDRHEVREETPVSIFHPTLLLLSAGVNDAFLAGDLFNLYVGFEILLFSSYVLITMGATRSRVRAGAMYVVVNLVSSALFLILLAVVYTATGTVNLAQVAQRLPDLPADMQLMVQALALTVFGIKAAVFPLSAWLPDSYPTAPAPVMAVFAGLLTKVGVYAMMRTQTLLFQDRPLTALLLVLAAASMLVGILGAVAQSELKRLLSFTLVSHVGFMVMGVALASVDALAAAVYYTAHHITVQTALFLVVGLIGRTAGTTDVGRVSGLARVSAPLALMFAVPALALAGIPPLAGFVGKLGLMRAGVADGSWLAWLVVVVAVVTSLLTVYVMAKVWNRAFWGTLTVPERSRRHAGPVPPAAGSAGVVRPLPVAMVVATVGLIGVSVGLAVGAGPLYDYCVHAARTLLGEGYVSAVLGAAS